MMPLWPAAAAALLGIWVTPLVAQETGALTGTVLEARTRRALAGVRVAVPGRPDLAVMSDAAGAYRLFHLPAGSIRVVAELPGYAAILETVPIGGDRVTVADFTLIRVDALLAEVVVRGVRRREEGSKVEDVTGRELEATGAATVGDALAQHLAGGEVLWSSGQVGAGASIVLRGLKSFTLRSQPAVYVDGVRLADGPGPGVSDARYSVLDLIDPSTVERIEVVRGPAALKYGAGASGGVLLIHTRRGARSL